MYHHLLRSFIHRFSFFQQYLIILSLSLILLLVFNRWWLILLLPLNTILANLALKRLALGAQSPFNVSGYIYKLLIRKRLFHQDENIQSTIHTVNHYETSIQKECDTYIRTIIARYVGVWYYSLISTDQEFPEDLTIIFNIVLNRLSDRVKSFNSYDFSRLVINLEQKHMEQYLQALDSYQKQRKQNRISQSLVEEFAHTIGFHRSISSKDFHAYLKALVELLLTDLMPESFHIYSTSHPGREFLTQVISNCLFLPLINQFSKPRMIFQFIVLLWETEDEKTACETNEGSFSTPAETIGRSHETKPTALPEHFHDQLNDNDQGRLFHLERIIYSASVSSWDTAYNSMSGAAYTVYVIQCETKSPFTSDASDRYTIRRRFREFLNLQKRLQHNPLTIRHCYDIDEIFRALPVPIDSMNSEIIRRRQLILEQYIQKLISNEVLNCSHDVLEFFAFNSDPNKQFEFLPPSKLPGRRVERVLLRTLSDVGTKLNNLLPAKREIISIRETFQLNISTTYENTSSILENLKFFIQKSSLRYSSYSLTLNIADSEFLQSLLVRPAIVKSRRKDKFHSDIPLTDAVLNLVHTCLHSRDALISYESIHQILRTLFGHLIEEFLKDQIDEILSPEKILEYLVDLRTRVLWPDDNNDFIPMKNVKHRAYNAILKKIPNWLQQIVGVENVRRIVNNFLQCLSYEELNRHLICNLLDLFLEQVIPNVGGEEFLTKYVQMHAGIRT